MLRDALPPLIRLMSIDRAAMSYTVTLTDGRTLSAPADRPPFDATSALTRLEFAPHDRTLTATTVHSDTVVFEVPTDAEDATPPTRPVVYLDQNQWSAIANSIHAPGRIRRPGEGEAAARIIELSREQRLTLPASAGHLHETTKWTDNTRRYALGLTVLQLSRGWMMRDPLQVRRDEIRAVLPITTPADAMRPVITLLPNTLNESTIRRTGPGYTPSPDLPAQLAFLASTLIVASAQIATMLDVEPIEDGADIGWADANKAFTSEVHAERRDTRQRRNMIDHWLLSDLRHELVEEAAATGVTADAFRLWWPTAAATLGTLPSVGMYRQMMHERHLNPKTTWRLNDLSDMVYLSCAAAYSDIVVCERHMGHMLRRAAQRLDRRVVVCTSLAEAIDALADRLN